MGDMMSNAKIAVLGGGASGIGVAKALSEAGQNFEIFEATNRLGGNWQPDGPASKMYDSVHLISSKRNTQFADFPMPREYPDYPHHSRVFAYLQQLAQRYSLPQRTRFETTVTAMQPIESGWRLTTSDGATDDFSYVVVCNGLLRRPTTPRYPGVFAGTSVHAANYKSADIFKGKRALVVGGGNSGCDIAVDAGQNATTAFHSTRRGYHYMPKFIAGRPTQEWLMDEAPKFADPAAYWQHVSSSFKFAGFDGTDYGLPAPDHSIEACHPIMNSQILYHIGHGDIVSKPDIAALNGDTVTFADGSQEQIDIIVWATGYNIDLPFLDKQVFDWHRELPGLFLRMVPKQFEDLLFVGYLNTPSGIGNLANIMGRFVSAYIGARERGSSAFTTVSQLKLRPEALDLGRDRFMQTERHDHEVDLWKFIKAVNFVTGKLDEKHTPKAA